MNALRVNGVSKRYRRKWALRDCTLAMPSGRVIGLVGPNGAGKTTLLRLTVGLLIPSSGTIEVFGRSPASNDPATLAQVGYVAQNFPLYSHFTVADLLHFGRSCNVRFDRQFAEQRLAQLGIGPRQRAGTLSGGQQAQVALALALAKRPRLLVLDEPMASLDPMARREFQQALMSAVATHDLTVLFSSHDVHELERVCDHLVLLSEGEVALDGDIETLLDEHRLLVGPRVATDPGHGSGAVIEAVHSGRHSTVLVRNGSAEVIAGWEAHRPSLEDLVLAYLRRPIQRVPRDQAAEVGA